MKFDKSTKILINLVLILVIALLVKSLITVPKDVYAKGKLEYVVLSTVPLRGVSNEQEAFTNLLNKQAEQGWKFHSYTGYGLVFER